MGKLTRATSTARVAAQSAYYAGVVLRDGVRMSAGRLVEQHAKKHPHRSAIVFEDRHYSYRSFNAAANRVSSTLASMGARPGDVVALLMDNRPEYLFTIIGCNKLGVVTSLIHTQSKGPALVRAITQCRPRWIIVGEEHLPTLHATLSELPVDEHHVLVWREGRTAELPAGIRNFNRLIHTATDQNPRTTCDAYIEDAMLYMYTSGTTGLSKVALIKNQRFLRPSFMLGSAVLQLSPRDVVYIALPLYHATGAITGWGSALAVGACVALRRTFSAREFWTDCRRYGATVFPYIGEVCRYLLHSPQDPHDRDHSVRVITGAGLREDVWKAFQMRFGIPRIVEFYGSTEGNVALVNLEGKPGMLGRLLPGQTVVRVDPATEELARDEQGHLLRSAVGEQGLLIGRIDRIARFDGYLDAEETRKKVLSDAFGEGRDYFSTGDLVQLHDGRYVSFVDRLGDTFRWKGENVSTTEVSMVLDECPGVVESNVYGVTVQGHEGRAGMAALNVDETFDVDVLARHVTERLPRYARPCFIRLAAGLQLTASFKYIKVEAQREGFDPHHIDDPLYVLDPAKSHYVKLTKKRFAAIQAGRMAL